MGVNEQFQGNVDKIVLSLRCFVGTYVHEGKGKSQGKPQSGNRFPGRESNPGLSEHEVRLLSCSRALCVDTIPRHLFRNSGEIKYGLK
jgi:hypothetical protein